MQGLRDSRGVYVRQSISDRLLEAVMVDPNSGCWLWTKSLSEFGYGQISVSGKTTIASRASYRCFVGDIPRGILVLHKCDTRACIRPDHLYLGTIVENTRDKLVRNRTAQGANHGMAKLTVSDVIAIRNASETSEVVAQRYGIGAAAVRLVRARKTWRHVP